MNTWEIVVGLECHVQLQTATKLFSPAPNRYGDPPNENVDVVDAGLPGTLPVVNAAAVRLAVVLGAALGSTIRTTSVFARKHYTYPDLPKGFQTSQFDLPICEGGALSFDVDGVEKTVRIVRAHLEEDAGKSLHVERGGAVDYNRAGTPLLEVVTAPDLRSPQEAAAFFKELRRLVVWLGVCDGNLEEGSMRADCNVSVRRPGEPYGTRTETKNLNSMRYIADAIAHEARRQVRELEAGRAIVQETRLWDPDVGDSRAMRGKEDAHDYRYFPDPDLPPLVVDQAAIDAARAALPELPRAKQRRFTTQLGLSAYDASVLCADASTAAFFEAAHALQQDAKAVANWTINEVLRVAKAKGGEGAGAGAAGLAPRVVAELVRLIGEGAISGKIAKDVFAEIEAGRGDDPATIVEQKGWRVVRDDAALQAAVDAALAQNDAVVQKILGGQDKAKGFLVGAVMKALHGKADPQDVNRALDAAIEKRRAT